MKYVNIFEPFHWLIVTRSSLAYCEICLTLAALFTPGRFNFQLYETSDADVHIAHDFFNAVFPLDSKGIRIQIN